MLSGEGNARERRKNNKWSNQQKSNLARAAHFFCTFFAVVLHDHNVKLPETFLWRKCRTCSRSLFFFTAAHFSLHWLPLAFLILSPPLQNFHVVLQTKNVSFVFYLSLQISVALFLVIEVRWPASFPLSLCLSLALYSKCVDMTINLSLILQKTRIQKQFTLLGFVFIDSLVTSALQTRVAMRFPSQITSSYIWVTIPVD